MATVDPNSIHLDDEQRRQLADLAEVTGKSWDSLLGEFLSSYRKCAQAEVSSESAFDALNRRGLIGCISDGSTDLSTNPKHMEGFGESDNETSSR